MYCLCRPLELPAFTEAVQLAQWLSLSAEHVAWLAPERLLGAEHCRYQLQTTRTGGLRLLEMPKVELKRVQRAILGGLLHNVALHEAAHGFATGRSVISHAQAHVGQAVVIRFDLQDFFGSVTAARVNAV